MKKYHFIFSNIDKNKKLKTSILKKYKNYSPRSSDVIVIFGGDGFMLETLKKYQKYKKPFYGMNRGSYGFLMNKFKSNNINKFVKKANHVTISALEMNATTKHNVKRRAFAINEISLLRQSRQAASLQIINRKKKLTKKLICDGVLVLSLLRFS